MDHQLSIPIFQETNWHKYNLAKTQEKRLFYELLNELCQIIPEPAHEKGRKPVPVKDLVFMMALKTYTNYSSRKIHYDLKEAEMAGYVKKAPHFNRLSEFLNCDITYDLLKKLLTITALPLRQLEDSYSIDSSGFGAYQYERWMKARWKNRRGWRNYLKGHIIIGTRTNVICSAEVTYGTASDIKQAPTLLEALSKNFAPKVITGDKAYSSYRVHQIIESMSALPFIAFRDNTNPNKKTPKIWNRMFTYFQTNRERFLKFYHQRSNVETTFGMIKMKLGEFLKSRNFEAQRCELMMKFIVHNICCLVSEIFENDIHIDFKKCVKRFIP